jgi:CHAT domain-containing protein
MGFYFAEQGRAQTLMSVLHDLGVTQASNVPWYLKLADRNIDAGIWKVEKYLLDSRSEDNAFLNGMLRLSLVSLYEAREKLRLEIAAIETQATNIQAEPSPGLPQIRTMIPPKMAFIEYFRTPGSINIFCATRNNYNWFAIPADSLYEKQMSDYLSQVSSVGILQTGTEFKNYLTLTQDLYAVLLGPCDKMLKGCNRILVSPDPGMGPLCLEALTEPTTEINALADVDYSKPAYLFKKYAFSYCYSAAWLASMGASQSDRTGPLMVFAPSYRDSTFDPSSTAFPDLPRAREEAEHLAEQHNGILYSGPAADASTFIREAPNAGILHLSMHTSTDEKDPLLSSLIFSKKDNSYGTLTLADLCSMRFHARLVVLAGCNSGYGKTARGEGMISLARAFNYSGSESVVMSLWPVSDKTGKLIMDYFYDALDEGMPADLALQDARNKFLKQAGSVESHPSYWAPFVLLGKGIQIETEADSTSLHWWWFLLLIPLLAFYFLHYRKHRH